MKELVSLSTNDALLQWLMFIVDQETYGIPVRHVREVLQPMEISSIPSAPLHVLGMVNLRGKVITVKEPHMFLALPSTKTTDMSRIIVLEWEGKMQGIQVDAVREIVEIQESEIASDIADSRYIEGIYQKDDTLPILLSISEIMREDTHLNDV